MSGVREMNARSAAKETKGEPVGDGVDEREPAKVGEEETVRGVAGKIEAE